MGDKLWVAVGVGLMVAGAGMMALGGAIMAIRILDRYCAMC